MVDEPKDDPATMPRIWVDADACPKLCKDVLLRVARRTGIKVIFVANRPTAIPDHPAITMIQVASGMDVADNEIVRLCGAGDLVITSDIPLAWEIIEEGGLVVTSRGVVYTAQNIKARLTMRDFMSTLRASGIETGGAPPLSQKDSHAFANYIDRFVAKAQKKHKR